MATPVRVVATMQVKPLLLPSGNGSCSNARRDPLPRNTKAHPRAGTGANASPTQPDRRQPRKHGRPPRTRAGNSLFVCASCPWTVRVPDRHSERNFPPARNRGPLRGTRERSSYENQGPASPGEGKGDRRTLRVFLNDEALTLHATTHLRWRPIRADASRRPVMRDGEASATIRAPRHGGTPPVLGIADRTTTSALPGWLHLERQHVTKKPSRVYI